MPKQYIKVRGAAENNLKHLNVDIPRNELVVLTGLSGSGKSSLAFETIYAEGQRRYMESLSSYARQFLGQMDKPDVESITGLSPAISIDQKSTNRNPRSTVGTVTEIYDYLRLLYARVGIPHCPNCGREIRRQTVDEMVEQLMRYPERTRIQILAPVVRGKKGRHDFEPLIIPVGEIRAGIAVGMDVDQAGDHQRTVEIKSFWPLAGEELTEATVPDREAAADKARRRKDLRILKNHIRPPAGWLRRCSGRRVEPSRPEA